MNDLIHISISKAIAEQKYPWLKSIVCEIHNQTSPFLTPDLDSITYSQDIFQTPVSKMLKSNGSELKISFDEDSSKDFSSNLFTNIHFSQISKTNPKNPDLHYVYLTFQIPEIETSVQFIEPIFGTLLLYDTKTKRLISDQWNFIPEISKQFLTEALKSTSIPNAASFHIDPQMLLEKDRVILIILLSHPTMVDNSAAVMKHYFNPTPISGNSLRRVVDATFRKNPLAFSTFAWTYTNISTDNPNQYDFQSPFYIDHPVIESEINYLISEAQNKHLRQLPFKITMKTSTELCPVIMRPLSIERVRPYLQPIHQLSVSLIQLKMSTLSSARNLMVKVSFHEKPNDTPLPVIHSKLNPSLRVDSEYSRIWYHEKSPKFDDTFLIDLPYPPKPTWALVFTIYHAHAKPAESKAPIEPIGEAVLPLLKSISTIQPKKSKDKLDTKDDDTDKNIFKRKSRNLQDKTLDSALQKEQANDYQIIIPNDVHTISLSSEKNSKLMVSTYLRSNIMTTDKNYYEFTKLSNSPDTSTLDPELIKSIEPKALASNMMIVIDTILNFYQKQAIFHLSPLLILRESLLPIMKESEFKKFLLLYAYFYAFRLKDSRADSSQKQISLNEQIGKINSQPFFPDLTKRISASEFNIPDSEQNLSSYVYSPDTLKSIDDPCQIETDDLMSFTNKVKSCQPTPLSPFPFDNAPQQNQTHEKVNMPLYRKIFEGTLQLLREKKAEAIDMFYPIIEFLLVIVIKSLYLSKDRKLANDFNSFVDEFSQCASSAKNIYKISYLFGRFVDVLFDIGFPSEATLTFSAFTRYSPPKAIANFVSTSLRPEFFLYSVQLINLFCETFQKIVIQAFQNENYQIMKSLFVTINKLCAIYDENLKVEIASKLLPCLTEIKPSKLPKNISIAEGIEFIDFILNYSNESSIQTLALTNKLPMLMSLLHYLLIKSTPRIEEKKERQAKWKLLSTSYARQPLKDVLHSPSKQITIQTSIDPNNLLPKRPSLTDLCNDLSALKNQNEPHGAIMKQMFGSQDQLPTISLIPSIQPNHKEKPGVIKMKLPLRKLKQPSNTNILPNTQLSKSRDEISLTEAANSESSEFRSLTTFSSPLDYDSQFVENDQKINEKILNAVYRFVRIFLKVSDLNGGTHLVGFVFHASQQVVLQHNLILESYEMFKQIIEKFSPNIIDIAKPCMTRILHTLFRSTLLSTQYHNSIASIVQTMFESDLKRNGNNNRSVVICTRVLSLIEYPQLLLDRFQRFINELHDLTGPISKPSETYSGTKLGKKKPQTTPIIDGMNKFFETFETLKEISIQLANPKLAPSQRSELLLRRFYAFKYSPDAQISVLGDLKKDQLKSGNDLEAINITILQAAIIYEYLIKLERMPNYFKTKFSGKHRDHFTITAKSALTKTKKVYFIGSTSFCPAEIQLDFPKCPGFCDPDVFSESGFLSFLYEAMYFSKKSKRYVFLNEIVDLIWPIYQARHCYEQMASIFKEIEMINNERFGLFTKNVKTRQIMGRTSSDAASTIRNSFKKQIKNEVHRSRNNSEACHSNGRINLDNENQSNENEEEVDDILSTKSYIIDNSNTDSFFRVMFCGKIFESDNGRAFIYRADPNTTQEQFRLKVLDHYEKLMGDGRIVILQDELPKAVITSDNQTKDENPPSPENSSANNNTITKIINNVANVKNAPSVTIINNAETNAVNATGITKSNSQSIVSAPSTDTKVTINHSASAEGQTLQSKPIISNTSSPPKTNSQTNSPTKDENLIQIDTDDGNDDKNKSESSIVKTNETTKQNENEPSKETETAETEEKSNTGNELAVDSLSNNQNGVQDHSNEEQANESESNNEEETNLEEQEEIDPQWYEIPFEMDENLGYIKVDQVNFVGSAYQTFQHQIFTVDEYSYEGDYRFIDDYFFNSSHNTINQFNFNNLSIFNNLNNTYENNSIIPTYDNIISSQFQKNTSSQGNSMNYNYSFFNIFNYMNNFVKMVIYQSQVPLQSIDITKRCMRRNFLAVRTQLPSVTARSEIIKVEAFDYSPIMVAYNHLFDFSKNMENAINGQKYLIIHTLLNDELVNNKVDNFLVVIDSFANIVKSNNAVEDKDDDYSYEEEEEHNDRKMFDDIFIEENKKIRQARTQFEKETILHFKELLTIFLKILQKGIELHSKWIVSNLEFVALHYRFESILESYKKKFNEIM